MSAAPPQRLAAAVGSSFLKYCRRCEHETSHQIRVVDGMTIAVCARCVERALLYELDRD
jgi:hypothetical protein